MSDDGAVPELLGAVGYPEEILDGWRRFGVDAAVPLAEAARTATPVFLESHDAWRTRYSVTGPLRALPASVAWAAIPLQVDGRVLGEMGLGFGQAAPPEALDAESRAFILALAQQCAQAFERARLHAAEREARVEAGELTVAREPGLTGRVVAAAVDIAAPQAAVRGVRLVADGPDAAAVPFVGDEHRTRRVVIDLLTNAIKFTEPGGTVTVRCALVPHAPPDARLRGEGPWACIRVEDTGIGIPPEHHEHVFEPFHQVESGYTRKAGGTGLGLAISRQMARLMGGDLTLESTPGAGSVCTLWLPSTDRPAAGEATGATNGAPSGAPGAPALVTSGSRGLAEIGESLRDAADAIVRAYVARLRADALTPAARALRRAELKDHAVTLLTDLAQSLVIIDDVGERAPELLADTTEIQRAIAERHGRRRHAQGWPEQGIRRDYAVLREEVGRAVRTRLTADAEAVREAVREAVTALDRLIARAGDVSIRAFREAERRTGA